MTDPAISFVIVSYNMTRQLRRTLLSLAPSYRRGPSADAMETGAVEVIVVDNGSDPPPTPDEVATPGLDVTLRHWREPTHSPVAAVNFGLSLARAPLITVMIDGARMASPGLIGAYLAASALHPRPVVVTYNYHLGPRPQPQSIQAGYDAQTEDRLLDSIRWPEDGYRLFDIAVPEAGQGWPGPIFESNALLLHRAMWDELGGYDPRFTSQGGGGVNADTLTRACDLPGAQLIKVAGEATFHQIHGGIITNAPDQRRTRAAAVEYAKIRGRIPSFVRCPSWLFDPRTGSVTTWP